MHYGFCRVTDRAEGQTEVVVSAETFGVDSDGAAVMRYGLPMITRRFDGDAEIVVGIGKVGCQFNGTAVMPCRLHRRHSKHLRCGGENLDYHGYRS